MFCTLTGIGAWQHISKMRCKPYQRMQVCWSSLLYYVKFHFFFLYCPVQQLPFFCYTKCSEKCNFDRNNCSTEHLPETSCYTTWVFSCICPPGFLIYSCTVCISVIHQSWYRAICGEKNLLHSASTQSFILIIKQQNTVWYYNIHDT